MPKPDKKGSINKGKQAQTSKKAPEDSESYINFGAITSGILESQKQFLGDGKTDPNFLRDLDAFATMKSIEIINSSVNNIPSTSGPQPPRPSRVSQWPPVEPVPRIAQIAPLKAPAPPPPAQKPKAPPPPQASVQRSIPIPAKPFARPQVIRDENLIVMDRNMMALHLRKPQTEHVPKILGRWKKPQNRAPQTMNTAFYSAEEKSAAPTSEEMMKRLFKEKRNRIDSNPAYLFKRPEEIARLIMNPKFADSFVFSIDMYVSNTGMSQLQSFLFVGSDTYTTFKNWFRRRYMCNYNFKMFYLNHDGRYFEVYDNRTFKMMLITQGAFPRGIHCTLPNRPAKVFCVPTSEFGEGEVSYYLRDLVFGIDQEMLNHIPDTHDYLYRLHNQLMPDTRYADLVNQVFEYTENDLNRGANKNTSLVQVMYWVQRKLLTKDFFEDRGNEEVTIDELELLLETRFGCPYIDKSGADSISVEIDVILDALIRSRHQTKQGIDAAYSALKKEAQRIIAEHKQKEIAKGVVSTEQLMYTIKTMEAKFEKPPPNVVAAPVRLQDMHNHRSYEPDGFKEFTVEQKANPNPGPYVELRRNKKVLEDPTGQGIPFNEVMRKSIEIANDNGLPGFEKINRIGKPVQEGPAQALIYRYHPEANESEHEARKYLRELSAVVEKKNEALRNEADSELERRREQQRHKKKLEEFSIDELVGEDDGSDLKTIDEDDEISSQEPSPISQDQQKVFVLRPARVESSEDEECPDLMDNGPPPAMFADRNTVPPLNEEENNREENQLERFPSQENVTITHECLDEEKISKTIIKVGMDKSYRSKRIKIPPGYEIRPSVIKSSISQEEEFMTPLGSVSTPPEGYLKSGLMETAEDDIETFQDCEEELHTPTKQTSEEKPPVPTSEVPDLDEGSKPTSPVKQKSSPTRETSSPIVSVKLSVAGSSSPPKKISPDSLKSLDSPALSSFTSTSEILDKTFSLLKPVAKTATPFQSSLQKLAKEKADAVEDIAGKESKPEDPSLSRVQTEEEVKAQEAEQKAKTPTTTKSEKLKTS